MEPSDVFLLRSIEPVMLKSVPKDNVTYWLLGILCNKRGLLKKMIHLDMGNFADAADMSMEINSSGNHPNILLQILFCFTKLRENMHFK